MAAVNLSRRAFLKGARRREPQTPRLPWLHSEAAFVDGCTRCGECLTHCPEAIIIPGDGGYPAIDFQRGECTFCGECARHCPEPLFRDTEQPPWTAIAVIGEHCMAHHGVFCQSCKDPCEPRAITFHYTDSPIPKPQVNLDECTGCGACVSVCPQDAITVQTNGEFNP